DQNEGIVIARNRLPKSNLGQMYLNVGTFIETIGAFTGMPVRSGQFANLPPIAAAVGVQNGSIGTRAYVPMSVITAIKNVATSSGLGIPIAAARPR
ncbi:MAG: hypothetical protein QGH33_17650, partial [Pirellulaceae bacterium]|nr:hypothetical protein [Pirellulaceae bacterium]